MAFYLRILLSRYRKSATNTSDHFFFLQQTDFLSLSSDVQRFDLRCIRHLSIAIKFRIDCVKFHTKYFDTYLSLHRVQQLRSVETHVPFCCMWPVDRFFVNLCTIVTTDELTL